MRLDNFSLDSELSFTYDITKGGCMALGAINQETVDFMAAIIKEIKQDFPEEAATIIKNILQINISSNSQVTS